MTKKTVEKFYSDLSGEEIVSANPTATFSLDGTAYEMELTVAERATLSDAMSQYIGAARQVSRKTTPKSGTSAATVRAWAIKQGIQIPAKGRIPLEIQAAFDKAN